MLGSFAAKLDRAFDVNAATQQARLAVDTRAFPLVIYDPRAGDTIKSRISLAGNLPYMTSYSVDGVSVTGNPYTGHYRKDQIHEIVASAPGYETKSQGIVLAKDLAPSKERRGLPVVLSNRKKMSRSR